MFLYAFDLIELNGENLRRNPLAVRKATLASVIHGRALYRFSDRLGIAEVVLLSLAVRADVFRRHRPSIVAKRLKLATEMMGTDAGFHPDPAGRQIGEPRFHLAARPFLPPSTIAPRLSRPTRWNEFLPISMPITATVRHGGQAKGGRVRTGLQLDGVPHRRLVRMGVGTQQRLHNDWD